MVINKKNKAFWLPAGSESSENPSEALKNPSEMLKMLPKSMKMLINLNLGRLQALLQALKISSNRLRDLRDLRDLQKTSGGKNAIRGPQEIVKKILS